ncbi:MAG: type II toxin-antitoxin system RelE/ParE family toxin [Betaproteobacteria bacterium]
MIHFDDGAREDLDRIFDFNFSRDPATVLDHIGTIIDAVQVLARHPEIGRDTGGSPPLRELVISHGGTGYIALYEYSPLDDLVLVVAIRHQREAGYQKR